MSGRMGRRGAAAGLAAALALAAGAQAADGDGGRAAVLKAVTDCRGVTDAAARLACYDSAVGRLDEADKSGEVVVLDRAQARAARREAFGFSMPSLSLFSRGEKEEALDRAEFTVTSARQDSLGKWIVELDTGAVWRQVDSEVLRRSPRAGSKAEIRNAALGSFFLNLDGQRAIRASRVK